jgi:hypothetical protein
VNFGKTILEEMVEQQVACIERAMPLLEDGASGVGDISVVASVSLAISMKRIADAFTYQQVGGENIHDMINAIRHNTVPHAR